VAWLTTPGISILPGRPRPRVRDSAFPTSRADRSSICKTKPAASQRVGQGEQEFLLGLVVFAEDKVVEPAGHQDRDERLLDRRTRVLDRRLEGVKLAVDGLGPLRFERTAGDDPHRDRRHRRRDATASAAILEALTPFFEDGAFQVPVIDRVIPLSEGCSTYPQVARGKARGRLVLMP
jgi:hypothetical protein